ncbi:hypothetical protein QTL86_03090 [Cellulosilyticum sp. ST5]|uniref:hypothetical protein n=1 Tax=Cellulosilyticum sp. ST5 TaxID=3055805 RepID=UPI003977A85A
MNGILAILMIALYIGIFYVGYWILRKAIEEGIYRAGKRLYGEINIDKKIEVKENIEE